MEAGCSASSLCFMGMTGNMSLGPPCCSSPAGRKCSNQALQCLPSRAPSIIEEVPVLLRLLRSCSPVSEAVECAV